MQSWRGRAVRQARARLPHLPGRKKGRIELEYYGVDDLNDLLDALALIKKRDAK
jgi:hypothetical protein